jgi:hypothetical protein
LKCYSNIYNQRKRRQKMDPELVTPVVPEAVTPPPAAPEITPTPAPATAEGSISDEPDESGINWGEIATENEIPEEEIVSPSSLDVEAVTPVKAAPGAAVAPPVSSPAPVPVSAQPVAAPPTPPPQPASTPEAVAPAAPVQPVAPVDHAKQRTDYLGELEKSYAMTEDEGVELLRAPETVLPKLAAQLQLNVMEQVIQYVAQSLPQFVESHLGQQKANTENRKSFFEAWPDLDKPAYGETLTRIATTYRQQNPTATKEKAIKEIGAIAAIALGVMPAGAIPPTPPSPPQPPIHRPIIPGGGGARPVTTEANEFTKLANEWGDE